MSFRVLDRQPTNCAIEGSHLCSVLTIKKGQSKRSVGAKNYIQATEQPNRVMSPIRCLSLIGESRNTVQYLFLRKGKNTSKAVPIVDSERLIENGSVCRL